MECRRYSTTKSEEQARKGALSITGKIVGKATDLMVLARQQVEEPLSVNILGSSSFITSLLPLVLAHISPLATSESNVSIFNTYNLYKNDNNINLQSAVQILNLIQEILPHVAALNLMEATSPRSNKCSLKPDGSALADVFDNKNNTTSKHYTLVESDHPYKASTVTNYRYELMNLYVVRR